MLVNLINISYCAMKILPYQNEHFSEYRTKSVQEFRFELSQGIRSQIFFATFVKNIETHIKSNAMTKALKQLIHQQVYVDMKNREIGGRSGFIFNTKNGHPFSADRSEDHSDAQITMNVYNHIVEKSHVENEMSKMNLPETVPAVV